MAKKILEKLDKAIRETKERIAQREAKLIAEQKKAEKREIAIMQIQADKEAEAKAKAAGEPAPKRVYRGRKYETVKVKVPYDRKIMNFSTPELLELFGGWFTLCYAFTHKTGRFAPTGKEICTDYWICSRDVSAIPPSQRPKKNAMIKHLFDKDVYGYAIVAPSSMFGGADDEEDEA